jgi:uridine kinase
MASNSISHYSYKLTTKMYYMRQQKPIILEGINANANYLMSLLKSRRHYLIINGLQASGKTSVSCSIAK